MAVFFNPLPYPGLVLPGSIALGVGQFWASTSNLAFGLPILISFWHGPLADELLTVGHIFTVLANPSDPSLPFLLIFLKLPVEVFL
jgi:hypothetical protein